LPSDDSQPPDDYQLIDFGNGRKLELVAGHCIDRPSPAANSVRRQNPDVWRSATSRYDTVKKQWTHHQRWPENLAVNCGNFRMPVRPTPHGHIGLFPEQAPNWQWLSEPPPSEIPNNEALNLFGYTGASTIALVRSGFRVAHVDAAKPNVQAVRIAANCNEMADPPIRYLVDDAAKFAAREVRRGRQYHTIVLDPPAYGHAPSGRTWRLERDLWPLLDNCLRLLDPSCFRLLITGHSPEVDQSNIVQYLVQTGFLGNRDHGLRLHSGRSQLIDSNGRPLDAGFFVQIARSR
jgi:23S rRNA (cytosine1962-C5)-methyltransferase